jgi:hypothetical protein
MKRLFLFMFFVIIGLGISIHAFDQNLVADEDILPWVNPNNPY